MLHTGWGIHSDSWVGFAFFKLIHPLTGSAWADGKFAELAEQVGRMVEHYTELDYFFCGCTCDGRITYITNLVFPKFNIYVDRTSAFLVWNYLASSLLLFHLDHLRHLPANIFFPCGRPLSLTKRLAWFWISLCCPTASNWLPHCNFRENWKKISQSRKSLLA